MQRILMRKALAFDDGNAEAEESRGERFGQARAGIYDHSEEWAIGGASWHGFPIRAGVVSKAGNPAVGSLPYEGMRPERLAPGRAEVGHFVRV